MATRFHIETVFKALDKFSAPVARMTTRMQRFTRRIRKGMGGIAKMTKRMARGFKNSALTLGSLAVMGGFALKGLLGPAVRFQHAMDGVNAVTLGAYKEHMPKLRKEALRLGKSTTFTATQVANAMEILAKSGLDANKTLALIEPTLLGAEAASTGISEMADIMVSTVEQMASLDAMRDGERVINAYAVAASSANTTIGELGEGMKKVIPVGEGLGFAFEDLLATTTLLQHMGIEASMSASQQRTFFTRLTKLTPKMAKSFRGMGIELLDANKNMKQIPELLAAVAAGFAKVKGNAPQIAKMAEAVGLRGGIAGNILIRNMGQLEDLLLRISTMSEGAAEKMSTMRLDNLFGDLVRLKSAWEFFRIDIGTGTLPRFREWVQGLTDALAGEGSEARRQHWAETLNEAVDKLDAFWKQHGDGLLQFAVALGGLAVLIAKLVAWTGDVIGWAGGRINAFAKFLNDLPGASRINRQLGLNPQNWSGYTPEGDPTVRGLASGHTQEKNVDVKGEIIIRDQSGAVVGVHSEGMGMTLQQEPTGGFFTPDPMMSTP